VTRLKCREEASASGRSRWWSGHIDFGELGVAAAATGAEFFAACGVEPDRARIDYHRCLWRAEDAASR